MHPDNKLANHGKQVTSDSRSQLANVNQQSQQKAGAVAHCQSPKGVGVGGHAVKTNQMAPANPGLKAASQSASGVGAMLKTKSKRERSVSVDSVEPRDALASALEAEAKAEGVMRSKRRCVLERKQPYSGDEWCSGPDTEEDEDKPRAAPPHRDRGGPGPGSLQGLGGRPSGGSGSDPGGPAVRRGGAQGPKTEPSLPSSQQVVYVFTTNLANSAAEAVLNGHSGSILQFHQQQVPRSKLEQGHNAGKIPSLPEKMSSIGSPPTGTPKPQGGTPSSGSAGGVEGPLAAGGPSSAGHSDNESPHSRTGGPGPCNNLRLATHKAQGGGGSTPAGPALGPGAGEGPGGMAHPNAGVSPSDSPSAVAAHLQADPGGMEGAGGVDGLSKEQREHRERSLQTLRDIERLLLRTGVPGGPQNTGGPNGNPNNNNNNSPSNNNNNNLPDGGAEDGDNGTNSGGNGGNNPPAAPMGGSKKYEEPLQSIISQTQSLGGPGMEGPPMDSQHHGMPQHPHHPHHHLFSPGLDMGSMMGPDGLTPEQMAWRKLQEEYYQEKRRQQEMQPPHPHAQHFRMMSEHVGMHGGGGGPMVMRGPPPPYHSKPDDQPWGPGAMMGGNGRLMEMHPDDPRGPRFLGQMQRGGPSHGGGGGFPGSPGSGLPMEGMGPQRPPRAGVVWLDDMPNNMGGGGGGGGPPFQGGCYPSGPPQHLQGDPERLLTREEMFRIMEKRQLQGLHRLEMERLAKQQQMQQSGLGQRMVDNPGGPAGFPNMGMGRCAPSRGDPMDFPGSREMLGSPGGGGPPQMRDLVDSPMGSNLNLSMNAQMSSQQEQQQQQQQQQQQMMLAQKLCGRPGGAGPLGEMLSPEAISRIWAAQNGRPVKRGMVPGPDGGLHFPNQGPFSGGQMEGPYLQQPGPEMFGPEQQGSSQMGGTPRLSHMTMAGGIRGPGPGSRRPSDLSININPMGSPSMPPPHQLKSPSLSQEPSPLLPSPSAPGLKSPSQMSSAGPNPPLPPASGAGTPSSASMKSPQLMGSSSLNMRSPSASPGHLKSPALHGGSPGWASPKTALPSPGRPASGKGLGNGGGSSTETGPSLPPRSSNSTPGSQPGSLNPSMPFNSSSSPDAPPPTQNPLSLIMNQMSKYAMPSTTPLYHDAIKTIATSDDEMMPDHPALSGVSIGGNMGNPQGTQMLVSQGAMGPNGEPQSPMGMMLHGQPQMSHDGPRSMLSSPNPMAMTGMNPAMMGPGQGDGMGHCNMSPIPQNQMGGFTRMQQQQQSHGPMHSPLGGLSHHYPQPGDDVMPSQQQMLREQMLLSKGHPHHRHPHPSDFSSMGDGPDLSEVIRTSHTGIPEFDLSRIIPSDKPSSTLQYFPAKRPPQNPHQAQGSGQHPGPPPQLLKQLSSGPQQGGPMSSNPHLAHLQNMMAEHQLPAHTAQGGMRQGMGMPPGASRGMGPGGGGMGPGGVMGPMGSMGPMCPPGHMMGRTGMMPQQHLQQQQQQQQQQQHHHHHHHQQQQQAMMASLHQASQPHPGMMSPQQHPHNLMAQQNLMMMQARGSQGPLMSPQGPMMGPPHRGMSLDGPLGPGGIPNMPF